LEQYCQLTVSKDFDLAYCPERINPGDAFWSIENIPRVIGATSVEGANRAANFYTGILDGEIFHVRDIRRKLRPKFKFEDNEIKVTQMPLGSVTIMNSIRDTEAVKVMENTVRDVNIALVNELAKISDVLSLDVVDIIDGMSTKPFGKGPFFPGAGVGGHCIAVDPEWLKSASSKAGYMPEMINLARLTNNRMPEYTVSLLQDLLNQRGYPLKNTDVALLGVAYKRCVDDPRESPFFPIRGLLQKKGARITVYDSWYRIENNVDNLELALKNVKAVIIITDHNDIVKALSEMNLQATNIEVIIDGRNCLDSEQISRQGVSYHGVGRK
jgi:UDP-N-acetyl-D-glucosamine dehydrogenase